MSVFNTYIEKHLQEILWQYIYIRKAIFLIYKENTIYLGSVSNTCIYIKSFIQKYYGLGKAKEKEMVSIYKRNTHMYIGKIHIQRIYLDKIYKKKKASFFYIYSKTHIFYRANRIALGKEMVIFPIKHTLQSGQNT